MRYSAALRGEQRLNLFTFTKVHSILGDIADEDCVQRQRERSKTAVIFTLYWIIFDDAVRGINAACEILML